MTAHRWVPPSSGVAHTDLPLWNAAMTHMEVPLALGTSGASLRLSPIAAPVLTGPLHVFHTPQGGPLYVHIDAFPFADLLGVDIDLAAVNDMPASVADAIHAGAAEILRNGFPQTLTAGVDSGGMLAVDGVQDLPDGQALRWFAAALDGLAPSAIFFSVGVSAQDACTFLADKAIQPRTVLSSLKSSLNTSITRQLGHATLDLSQMRQIAPGDFIVLERAETAGVTLCSEGHSFSFEQTDEGWRCDSVHPIQPHRKSPPMADHPADPMDSPQDEATVTSSPPDIAAVVATTLTFDCGETRVSLAELESFQVGAIVTLPEELTKDGLTVTIRSGDTAIAMGDLVQVDDRVAVRINRLLTKTS